MKKRSAEEKRELKEYRAKERSKITSCIVAYLWSLALLVFFAAKTRLLVNNLILLIIFIVHAVLYTVCLVYYKKVLQYRIKGIKRKKEKKKKEKTLQPNEPFPELGKLIAYYEGEGSAEIEAYDNGTLSPEEFDNNLWTKISDTYGLNGKQADTLSSQFYSFLTGYDVLEEPLRNRNVTEIKASAFDRVEITINGRIDEDTIKFLNPEHYKAFIERLLKRNRLSFDNSDLIKFADKRTIDKAILHITMTSEYVSAEELPGIRIKKSMT